MQIGTHNNVCTTENKGHIACIKHEWGKEGMGRVCFVEEGRIVRKEGKAIKVGNEPPHTRTE